MSAIEALRNVVVVISIFLIYFIFYILLICNTKQQFPYSFQIHLPYLPLSLSALSPNSYGKIEKSTKIEFFSNTTIFFAQKSKIVIFFVNHFLLLLRFSLNSVTNIHYFHGNTK